jgi:DNA-binding beta-propeller fold protein YncE
MEGKRWWWAGLAGTVLTAGMLGVVLVSWPAPPPENTETPTPPPVAPVEATPPQRYEGNGVAVEFTVVKPGAFGDGPARLFEGDRVDARFRLADAATGEPLRGLYPASWVDLSGALPGDGEATSCKEKVPLFLKGHVGLRPLVDLNGYFLLVLNQDPTISVIDPVVGMPGKTSLFATVLLRRPGADWAESADRTKLFVSMPRADAVAVVDLERFRVVQEIETGPNPGRVVLQEDGRYLWVGHGGPGRDGGVTVIDTERLEVVARIPTGRGHHEIAFGSGDRLAFVTNRDDGTVTAIDVSRLEKVKDWKTGPVPISIARSPLSRSIYVADGKTGEVAVLDPERLAVVSRISVRPGLGPLRFAPGGRYGFVVNPAEQAVHVLDASGNRLVRTIPVPGQPFEVAFTELHAYVRLLDSDRVQMIRLASVDGADEPIVQSFSVGTAPPKVVPDLPLAASMVPHVKGAGVFVVAPGDGSTFGYMEGMNATAGSFQNYGHPPRAVRLADRSLRETEPGVYSASLVLPAAGTYDVALLLENPRAVACFQLSAHEDPRRGPNGPPLRIDWTGLPEAFWAGATTPVRFRLEDPATRGPKEGLGDVRLAFHATVGPRTEVAAREVEPGIYEAAVRFPRPGAYFLHVESPGSGVRYGQLPFRTVRVDEAPFRPVARSARADGAESGGR